MLQRRRNGLLDNDLCIYQLSGSKRRLTKMYTPIIISQAPTEPMISQQTTSRVMEDATTYFSSIGHDQVSPLYDSNC